METQFFIKAGPDHGEESTPHPCPTKSFRTFFFAVFLDLPCLSFPFNLNVVQKLASAFVEKKNVSLFFCCELFFRTKEDNCLALLIALVNLGHKDF